MVRLTTVIGGLTAFLLGCAPTPAELRQNLSSPPIPQKEAAAIEYCQNLPIENLPEEIHTLVVRYGRQLTPPPCVEYGVTANLAPESATLTIFVRQNETTSCEQLHQQQIEQDQKDYAAGRSGQRSFFPISVRDGLMLMYDREGDDTRSVILFPDSRRDDYFMLAVNRNPDGKPPADLNDPRLYLRMMYNSCVVLDLLRQNSPPAEKGKATSLGSLP